MEVHRSKEQLLAPVMLALLGLVWASGSVRASESPPAYLDLSERLISRPGQLSKAPPAGALHVYGGPGTLEGKFENAVGEPDWQGWTSADLTEETPRWQVETIFAENLNNHGPGNHAFWSGHTAEQEPTWSVPPGYGNNWDTSILWTSGPLQDSQQGQTVDLDFVYQLNLETGYDYFRVQYEKAGSWVEVFAETGLDQNNPDGTFPPPGRQYSAQTPAPIVYDGGDYGGPDGDEIRLRLRLTSDGAHSASDNTYIFLPSGIWVDDITVTYSDGVQSGLTDFADFEGGGPFSWQYDYAVPFFGDFAKILGGLNEYDPCLNNSSPQLTFINDGTPVNNAPPSATDPIEPSSSPNHSYGTAGGYVVPITSPYDLSGELGIDNEVRSPPIAWELPGPEDDDLEAGALLRFKVWRDLPLDNLVFYRWRIRSSDDGGVSWSGWEKPNFIYFSNDPTYSLFEADVTAYLVPGVTHVQIALGATTLYEWCGVLGPCGDSTPGPWFDDVELLKYQSGPILSTNVRQSFQDTFAPSGASDPIGDPAALACRLDTGIDLGDSYGVMGEVVPEDSMVITATLGVPGTTLNRVEMVWRLDVNPLFAGVRQMPPGTTLIPGGAPRSWDQWSGAVAGQQLATDDFSFDLPFEPATTTNPGGPELMLFPGDRLRYYFEAEDSAGNITRLPSELSGLVAGDGYDTDFTVRMLPSMVDDGLGGICQPEILVIDNAGDDFGREQLLRTFAELGLVEGIDFDLYTHQTAGSSYSSQAPDLASGIGTPGAHGATPAQLDGYSCIVLSTGSLDIRVLTDGDGVTNQGNTNRGDDIGVLTAWHELAGPRSMIHAGDNLLSSMAVENGLVGSSYLADILGSSVNDENVYDEIGQQSTPLIEAASDFLADFALLGGKQCTGPEPLAIETWSRPRSFDSITALPAATTGHGFQIVGAPGSVYPGTAASVIHDRLVNGDRKIDISFPFDLTRVGDVMGKAGQISARARLLAEAFDLLGIAHSGGTPVGNPPQTPMSERRLSASPNPFNPRTQIRLALPAAEAGAIRVYNLQGALVREVHQGAFKAGVNQFTWDGRDDQGGVVSSGIYFVRASTSNWTHAIKLALVR